MGDFSCTEFLPCLKLRQFCLDETWFLGYKDNKFLDQLLHRCSVATFSCKKELVKLRYAAESQPHLDSANLRYPALILKRRLYKK